MLEKFLFRSVVAVSTLAVMAFASVGRADTFGTGENQFSIDFVTISGDTNPTEQQANEGDLHGYGIVTYDYRMGMHEITNDQWDKFVAAYGTPTGDPTDAYDESPTGINFPYVPTNNVSWYEAAQFVNWLNTSTSHQAAYNFTGTQGTSDYALAIWSAAEAAGGMNLYRHKDAFYFLPTEDEWVKAAIWNGTTLQTYATKPGESLFQGNGSNGGWNYYDRDDDDYGPDGPAEGRWNVGSGSEELNGTYDMMGNVKEWMENPYSDSSYGAGSWRGAAGGDFTTASNNLPPWVRVSEYNPRTERVGGFRVASVPEPGSITLLVSGLLVCLIWWRRKK